MTFQAEPDKIRWRVRFQSPPERVFDALTTDAGRSKFWAESTIERDGVVEFNILNYPPSNAEVLNIKRPHTFSLNYFGTPTTFTLSPADAGGTDMEMVAEVEDPELRNEMTAGWVSVLLAMKAAVDHGVDLRNHDADLSWQQGYVGN